MKILFYGDSITDSDRDREDKEDLGTGYPQKIAAWLAKYRPDKGYEVVNRGISGNTTDDLLARLEEDCLSENPDFVSVLIGINDTWHNLDGSTFGSEAETERFEKNYLELIDRLRAAGKKIIIMEPYLLPYPEDRLGWRKDLNPKIQVVRQTAIKYALPFVSLDGLFHEYAAETSCQALTGKDGVHPTDLGFTIIANAWLAVAERHDLFPLGR